MVTRNVIFVTLTLADAQQWPELQQAAHALGAHSAVLQGDGPTLVEQLDALACTCDVIELVGVKLAVGPSPSSWLGRVASWWLANRCAELTIRVHHSIIGLPTALPSGSAREILPKTDTLTSSEWADIPHCRQHLLVCRGPRCSAQGAAAIATVISQELERRGLTDDDILVSHTGCLYPCNVAPVLAIQPDMCWHGSVTEETVRALIQGLSDRSGHHRARLIP